MYFDPYMQKALLLDDEDPNALLEATGAPVAAPPAPQYPSPTFPGMSPTGPLGASQGMSGPDPRLMGMAGITDAFNSLAGGGANVFKDMAGMHQQLQMERMRQLRQNASAAPASVREFQYVQGLDPEQRDLYFKVKRGDQRTSQQKNAGTYEDLGFSEDTAFKLASGDITLQESDGVYRLFDETTGQVLETPVSATQASAIKSANASAVRNAEADVGQFTKARDAIQALPADFDAIDYSQVQTDKWLELAESGELDDTGFVTGLISDLLGIQSEQLAEMEADAVQQQLLNLQITNLAPVTEKELKLLANMWGSSSFSTEKLIGALRSSKKRLARQRQFLEQDLGRQLKLIKKYGGDEEEAFYRGVFGVTDDPEEILKNRGQ